MTSPDWAAQVLPLYEETPWSPRVPGDFEGLALWLPDRIALGETGGRLPVSGLVRLGAAARERLLPAQEHPLLAVVVGVVLGGLNQPYVGNAVLQAPLFPPAEGPVITEFFNVDLLECSAAPRTAGHFFVFGSLGPHLAGPRRVEVVA